jgi:hypothetical protein
VSSGFQSQRKSTASAANMRMRKRGQWPRLDFNLRPYDQLLAAV